MPTFDTPESITVTLEIGVADVRITAGERTDTVVDVRPPPRPIADSTVAGPRPKGLTARRSARALVELRRPQ